MGLREIGGTGGKGRITAQGAYEKHLKASERVLPGVEVYTGLITAHIFRGHWRGGLRSPIRLNDFDERQVCLTKAGDPYGRS
jgi:hypothetical protein